MSDTRMVVVLGTHVMEGERKERGEDRDRVQVHQIASTLWSPTEGRLDHLFTDED